nr:MAG TPA: replicative helicase [Caudoviricetes sp.]
MMKTRGAFTRLLAQNRKIFEAHGVDTSQRLPSDHKEFLEQREQRLQRDAKQQQALYNRQKAKVYQNYSLWPNDVPMHFTFRQWKPALQKDQALARQIGMQALTLARQLNQKPFNVFMNGLPGVGKTSLALAMLDSAKQQGLSTMFVSTTILQSLYRQSFQDDLVKEQVHNTVRAMKEVDVLVLDDFGTEGGSLKDKSHVHQDMQRGMYEVANARFDDQHRRPKGHTIITTNNFEEELNQIYDPKVISRLVPRQSEYRIGFNGMNDVRGV